MSCSQPFKIPHTWTNPKSGFVYNFSDYEVPCGWCLNCRRDKQNYYCDRAEYELKNKLTASFVTFTYDDNFLLSECLPDFPCYREVNNELIPIPTLVYKHLTNFIQAIRKKIEYHKEWHGVLCQPDFSYIYCGEYGDSFETGLFHRPHFHVIFFGLDFAFCKKLIFESWTKGFIDCLPVLDGAIRYLTKYFDKQTFGEIAEQQYDFNNIARPRVRMSKGFGKGLCFDKLDDVVKNNYTYPIAKGMRRPISTYWKNLITGGSPYRTIDTKHYQLDKLIEKYLDYHPNNKISRYDLKHSSKKVLDDFKIQQSRLREEKLKQQLLNKGQSVFNPQIWYTDKYGYYHYNSKLVHNLSLDKQKILADSYLNKLLSEVS